MRSVKIHNNLQRLWKEPDERKAFTEEEENISKERVQRMEKKGIIFDLDGTILDSMHIWEEIDKNFLGKEDWKFRKII